MANVSADPAMGANGLYNHLAVLRVERNLTRHQLADAIGVNYQTIGFLERGTYAPSLLLAFSMSRFFGLPIEAIFSTEPYRPMSERIYSQMKVE